MNEVTTKVAKALAILKTFDPENFEQFGSLECAEIKEMVSLLQAALDKLCEETK